MTFTKGRFFDMLVGVLIGTLGTGAASMFVIGQRVAALEVEVRSLRRDIDRIAEANIQLQENKGDIAGALAKGER